MLNAIRRLDERRVMEWIPYGNIRKWRRPKKGGRKKLFNSVERQGGEMLTYAVDGERL